jgi:hypothetical protein
LDANSCENAVLGLAVLDDVAQRVESYQAGSEDFGMLVADAVPVARYCLGCAESADAARACLLLAEFLIFPGNKDDNKWREIERLVQQADGPGASQVDLLRCRPRSLAGSGN